MKDCVGLMELAMFCIFHYGDKKSASGHHKCYFITATASSFPLKKLLYVAST